MRITGQHKWLNTYTPHFARHLHHLAISGFYARELDADDHEFIEYVKVRGIANGTLPCTNTVLIEELEYWHLPYAIDHTIKRAHGPVPVRGKGETPESKAARTAAWRARNAQRLADKAVMQAELERERKEYEAARLRRKVREMMTDAEWDAAAPKRRVLNKFYAKNTDGRYYVPQWKRDEVTAARKAELDAIKARRAEARRIQAEAQAVIDAKREAEYAKRRAAWEDTKHAAQLAERVAKEATDEVERLANAARIERVNRELERRQREFARRRQGFIEEYDPVEIEATKKAIMTMIRMTYPTVWTPERLTASLGLAPEKLQFVVFCAEEMVRHGQLRTGKTKVPV